MDCTELRLGWRAILGVTVALLSGIACLPYYTASLFVTSLQHEFGWSRAAISLGPSMLALGQVVTTPFIGILVDRIDARKLVPFGVLIVALAFGWLSIMNGSFLQYFAAMSLMAFIGGLATGTTATRIIAETFRSSRGAALGIVLSGIGLGAAAGSTLVARVIHTYGWRGGYLAMGLFSLTMTPLIHLLLRGRGRVSPSPDSYSGDTLREAFSKPLYWCLSDAFFFVSLGSAGLIIHFVPLLTDRGMNAKEAAAIASVIGLFISVSRLFTGFMIDRLFAPRFATALMLLTALSYVLFITAGPRFAVVGAIAIGISYGAEMDLIGYMVSRYFGLRCYGRLYGLMYSICLLGTFLSPLLYGLAIAKDHLGTYVPMIIAAIILLIIAAVILFVLPAFPRWNDAGPPTTDVPVPDGQVASKVPK